MYIKYEVFSLARSINLPALIDRRYTSIIGEDGAGNVAEHSYGSMIGFADGGGLCDLHAFYRLIDAYGHMVDDGSGHGFENIDFFKHML